MKNGDRVRLSTNEQDYEGIIMPHERSVLVLKLDTGYNVGILKKNITRTMVLRSYRPKSVVFPAVPTRKDLPSITILHTGGTIASKVDYDTGGVIARFSPEELLSLFPELRELANIESRLISNMWSEDLRFAHYNRMALEIEKEVKRGVRGIIITHGTDTLHYTGAALSFMLENIHIPVILVGAQRSSDRPSSDAGLNLIGATLFITQTDFKGVALAMHETIDDNRVVILSGLNTRKMHTSRRDAFQSINVSPLAHVDVSKQVVQPTIFSSPSSPQSPSDVFSVRKFNERLKVGVLKVHTHMYAEEFLCYKNFDGLVIEGTGLGHVPINEIDDVTKEHTKIAKALGVLVKKGVTVVIAPQTISGRLNLHVYSTGRKLQALGIIGTGCDSTPETVFIKLAWLLSNYPKTRIKELYEQNLRGELHERDEYGRA